MTDLAAAPRFTWRAPALLRVGVVASLLFLLLGFVSIVWTPYPVNRRRCRRGHAGSGRRALAGH